MRQPQFSHSHTRPETLDPAIEDIQFLQYGGLAAVVRSVQLADFEPEAIRARMHDASWLEVMATHHHEVIESIHRRHAILPVTFGSVYPDEFGLRKALSDQSKALLDQLELVADCDEWTIRLYADATTLEQRLLQEHPRLRLFQREISSVAPGRAYLLKRKLANEIATVMDQVTAELAGREFERIGRNARAGIVQARNTPAPDNQNETEILRAVYLVPRPELTAFLRDVETIASREVGMHGEYSGPWPPYSFARLDEEQRSVG